MLIIDPNHILQERRQWTPEHRLCAAVLEEAISSYQKNVFAEKKAQRRLFLDAEQWFRNNHTHWPFSFLRVCEVLNLNPDYVREGLMQWKTRSEVSEETAPPPLAAPITSVESFEATG